MTIKDLLSISVAAVVIFLVWVLSGIVFDYFHNPKPDPGLCQRVAMDVWQGNTGGYVNVKMMSDGTMRWESSCWNTGRERYTVQTSEDRVREMATEFARYEIQQWMKSPEAYEFVMRCAAQYLREHPAPAPAQPYNGPFILTNLPWTPGMTNFIAPTNWPQGNVILCDATNGYPAGLPRVIFHSPVSLTTQQALYVTTETENELHAH